MIALDWSAFWLGAMAGSVAGVLFFAGLAFGMSAALRLANPATVLLLSSALRIALLLGGGWLIAGQGLAALGGYALAFVIVRFIAIAIARAPVETEIPSWN